MLEELEGVAQTLNMVFACGLGTNLDDFVRNNQLSGQYLLFHNGYFKANLNEDGQGAVEFRHDLYLRLLAPAKPSDQPFDKYQHLQNLKSALLTLYKQLKPLGQISNARVVMGLNLTTSNLDAIDLTCQLLPDAVSLCNY